MGEVYRAEDLELNEAIALKLLPERLERHPKAVSRLKAELRTARQITHPNVCRVYDLVEIDGLHLISMEYLPGEDLRSQIKRLGRPVLSKAVELALQLCAALSAMHERKLLHRDIKPSNLMLDSQGILRLMDFGLAGRVGDDLNGGSPPYMAPELWRGSESTQSSDLYAIGLVLYELFTGHRVFRAESTQELGWMHAEMRPLPPSQLVDGLTSSQESIVLSCLRKKPSKRPSSAAEVAAALSARERNPTTIGIEKLVVADGDLGRGSVDLALIDTATGSSLSEELPGDAELEIVQVKASDGSSGVRNDRSREGLSGDPGHWNVPNRNRYFSGRDQELQTIERRFSEPPSLQIQMITGLGGVGKTQLAVEYCHRFRKSYPAGVFWAGASSSESLKACLAAFALGRRLAVEHTSVEHAAESWLKWASTTTRWLLVLDNANELGKIEGMIPQTPDGCILITSRSRQSGLGRELWVDVLSPDSAATFLQDRARRADSEAEDCRSLANALAQLPLALEQAGTYLAHHRVSVRQYLDGFIRRRLKFLDERGGVGLKHGGHAASVATIWSVSFAELESSYPAASEVLEALAFIDAENIPFELFDQAGPFGPASEPLDLQDPFVVQERLIAPLTRYSFIQIKEQDQTYSMHRLVQDAILGRLEERSTQHEVFERIHLALSRVFPQDPTSPASWKASRIWFPHTCQAMSFWQTHGDLSSMDLWNRAASYAWSSGRASVACGMFRDILEASRRVLGAEHPKTLSTAGHLALAMRSLGDAGGALALHEEVLPAHREVFGKDHPYTLSAINNFAVCLAELGHFREAHQLHRESWEGRCRIFGEAHPETLTSLANLGASLWALGDLQKARALEERLLQVRCRVLGEEHPETLTAMANLATSLFKLGEPKAARQLEEKVLQARSRVLGREHPDTLTSMVNLAQSLSDLGELDRAKLLQEDALEARRRVLGIEHPSTLTTISNLAVMLGSMGDVGGARELQRQVLEIYQRIQGQEHPGTLTAKANLAVSLWSLDDVSEAHQLHGEVLEARRRVLGEKHPDYLASLHNYLCTSLQAEGAEPDPDLIEELLSGVRDLPESMELRMTAEQIWADWPPAFSLAWVRRNFRRFLRLV